MPIIERRPGESFPSGDYVSIKVIGPGLVPGSIQIQIDAPAGTPVRGAAQKPGRWIGWIDRVIRRAI